MTWHENNFLYPKQYIFWIFYNLVTRWRGGIFNNRKFLGWGRRCKWMGHTNIWQYLKKIGPLNMAQANVTIFLVQFLIQSMLDQECNQNRRQIAMPLVGVATWRSNDNRAPSPGDKKRSIWSTLTPPSPDKTLHGCCLGLTIELKQKISLDEI